MAEGNLHTRVRAHNHFQLVFMDRLERPLGGNPAVGESFAGRMATPVILHDHRPDCQNRTRCARHTEALPEG